MELSKYSWLIDTSRDPQELREVLSRYRPFRLTVNFSNGFSTREFGDSVAYASDEPLAKLASFGASLTLGPATRILDIGSHLGYYGHHFIKRGIQAYVGVEMDKRTFDCAELLRDIAGIERERLTLINDDFGADAQNLVGKSGPYDIILSLASANNILSLTGALFPLLSLLKPDGLLVLEYLAVDSGDPVCHFQRKGFRGDSTLYWIFSEKFVDDFLGALGLEKTERLVEWRNREALGDGYAKIMAIYRPERS